VAARPGYATRLGSTLSATVDTNVLLYAANADDPAHDTARELLVRLAGGPDLFYLFWPTIMGFLRIATHPAIFPNPYTPEQAAAAIAGLLDRPNVRTSSEHEGFWELYSATASDQTRGNHVPDAYLAALMRHHGVAVIYTRDRDFRRYDGIDPRNPFA
jgi:toxin-antitoxin system PIN domain toxin